MSIPTIQMATAMRMVVGRLMRGDSGRMMALYLQRKIFLISHTNLRQFFTRFVSRLMNNSDIMESAKVMK